MAKLFLATTLAVFLFAFNHHNKSEVEAAMQHYNRLLQKMDVDSIAWLYAEDGDLGAVAHGRDAIRAFLCTFKNVRVLRVTSQTDWIKLKEDTSRQSGRYTQVAAIDKKDTAHWLWQARGWHIKRMETTPQ